jgi:cell division protein ZapE
MDRAWARLTDRAVPMPARLDVLGRVLELGAAAKSVARTSFDALCTRPLGSADYLALARHFDTLLLDGIPRLGPDEANEARRFTLLIDTLYDAKVTLVCSAAVPPDRLFAGEDENPWFRRTVSRLMEMQSAEYLRHKRDAALAG